MTGVVPKTVIEEIRLRNDIVDVVGSYVPSLKRVGSAYKALCPFHKEKTASFQVHPQRQIYHCFGCHKGGDVINFVMEHEGVDFSTALRILADRAGIRLEVTREQKSGVDKDLLLKIHGEVAELYHGILLRDPAAAAARDYLERRSLAEGIVKEYRIGFAPDRWDFLQSWARERKYTDPQLISCGLIVPSDKGGHYDRFRNRVLFPIRDEIGRVVAFSGRTMIADPKAAKYVNSPDTPLFRKGRILFGLDRARKPMVDSRSAILVEGQIDCIRCQVSGFVNTVAAQGTALTEEQAQVLKRYTDELTLVLDADNAGREAAVRGADLLMSAGLSVRVAVLPPDQDPDSLILQKGADAFRAVLRETCSAVRFHIEVLRSREDLSREAGLMRAARAVLEMIRHAPTSVQREQMLREAAQELKISQGSLERIF